ncbi:MAG: DNA-directed RNA polymerase subunit omega [Kiritimatiellae bacterium]|nr:DNA-directed RNA polymerase subunit omega [Kiritimatiellia bacterium]
MNLENLNAAKQRVPNASVLINMVSKRVKQLIFGDRPLVKPAHPDEDIEDIVLREIADGKLVAEIDFLHAKNVPRL